MFTPFASFSTPRAPAMVPAAAQGHGRSTSPTPDQGNGSTRLESAVQHAEHEAALWDWAKDHFCRRLQCASGRDLVTMLQQHMGDGHAPGAAEAPIVEATRVQPTPASSTESVSSVTAQMGAMNLGSAAARPTRSSGSQHSTASRDEQNKVAEIEKLKRDLAHFEGKAVLWRALKDRHTELGFESAQALQEHVESAINPRTPSPTLPAEQLRRKLRCRR